MDEMKQTQFKYLVPTPDNTVTQTADALFSSFYRSRTPHIRILYNGTSWRRVSRSLSNDDWILQPFGYMMTPIGSNNCFDTSMTHLQTTLYRTRKICQPFVLHPLVKLEQEELNWFNLMLCSPGFTITFSLAAQLHPRKTHSCPIQQFVHATSLRQRKGQSSLTLPTAGIRVDAVDTDTVEAATTARSIEKRIVCEDVIWVQIDLPLKTVGGRLVFMRWTLLSWWAHQPFRTVDIAMPADRHL